MSQGILTLDIDDLVYKKVMYWVNKSSNEVSGLGKVVLDQENKVIKVIDAMLFEQENSSSTTDINAEDIAKAMYHLRNTPGELRWWWHSHVKMNVFWSPTDQDTIKELGANGWIAATVFNQREEVLSAYCQAEPVQLFVPEIPTNILQNIPQELIKAWDREYKEKVKTKTYITQYTKYSFPSSIGGVHNKFASGFHKSFLNRADEKENIKEVDSIEDLPPGFILEGNHYDDFDFGELLDDEDVALDESFAQVQKQLQKPKKNIQPVKKKRKKKVIWRNSNNSGEKK